MGKIFLSFSAFLSEGNERNISMYVEKFMLFNVCYLWTLLDYLKGGL
jgi:hypothetical protein